MTQNHTGVKWWVVCWRVGQLQFKQQKRRNIWAPYPVHPQYNNIQKHRHNALLQGEWGCSPQWLSSVPTHRHHGIIKLSDIFWQTELNVTMHHQRPVYQPHTICYTAQLQVTAWNTDSILSLFIEGLQHCTDTHTEQTSSVMSLYSTECGLNVTDDKQVRSETRLSDKRIYI